MCSLSVRLSGVWGRNTVFHQENSYKEDVEDFIPKALPSFTGIQNVLDILTSLKD